MMIRQLTWNGVLKNAELSCLRLSDISKLHSAKPRRHQRLILVWLGFDLASREPRHLDFDIEAISPYSGTAQSNHTIDFYLKD